MTKLLSNRFIRGTLTATVVYAAFCALAPAAWLTGFVSAALLTSSMIVFGLYVSDALAVIKRGETGDGELALLAVTALAGGAALAGLFGLIWTIFGQPSDWLGTWFSNMGRAIMIPAFVLLMVSPDATREGIKLPPWYLLVAGGIAMAFIGFLFGAQFEATELMVLPQTASPN